MSEVISPIPQAGLGGKGGKKGKNKGNRKQIPHEEPLEQNTQHSEQPDSMNETIGSSSSDHKPENVPQLKGVGGDGDGLQETEDSVAIPEVTTTTREPQVNVTGYRPSTLGTSKD